MQGFKNFLMRGNVVELAVAVVIGTAFTGIVAAFTEAIINPLLANAFQVDELEAFEVGGVKIGLVLAAVLNFLIIAAICYFVLILPMQKLTEAHDRLRGVTPEEPAETDVDVLRDIRDLLREQQADANPAAPPASPAP
ncbi:large conductance mechanosensitive channel protein MscL [Agrococcus terreus]|uniref:Large conductance mechanosensitive channel protein MscL n=1 Tax=Agrococcus terreus TaxID=574649 RepID=A0ABQ2KFK1_9MICO|nr:large conductance mechanosensitive channel protein MscL [Agrococcus terreus]GGN79708.1 large conductance mechanosensitive channel protein MscL [Agrococcus terreus]